MLLKSWKRNFRTIQFSKLKNKRKLKNIAIDFGTLKGKRCEKSIRNLEIQLKFVCHKNFVRPIIFHCKFRT